MHKNTRSVFFSALFVFAAAILFSGTAAAQELPKTEISNTALPVPNYGYTMSFVRVPGTPDNEAVLRITQPAAVNGCVNVTTPPAEAQISGPTLKVIVSAPIVTVDDTPQYRNNSCKRQSPTVTSDVVLNRDQIISAGISQITFNGPGGADTYDIYADQDKIYFFTKIRDAERGRDMRVDYFDDKYFFKPAQSMSRHTPLTHWFYPENVVILDAPAAGEDRNIAAKIESLASRKGFIRLDTFLKGFEPPATDKNTVYFVDQTGITAKSLQPPGSSALFGAVSATETFQGPNGPYEREKHLDVMARLPGTFD